MAAVFLDRDDTLIACTGLPAPPAPAAPGDLIDPGLVELLPGVLDSCRALHAAGHTLVVVSNQGTVARGGGTIRAVEAVNARVADLLRDERGLPLIACFYFCPFHPRGNLPAFTREHPWRKPGAGMLLAAAADFGLDLPSAWLIGDAERDIESGVAAGLSPSRCLRVDPSVSFAAAASRILCA
ncbi:MAG: HAD-IIIA family hydrolase [Phycisphaerales bacterium]